MDIDDLRRKVQQKFNPLQTKAGDPLPESIIKSEPEDPTKPKSMLQQALENRLQSEQTTIKISEADREKLRKKIDGNIDLKLMNRLLRGHD